ncbi:MAG: hypothetical protein KME23_28900 [Goleter apudmare HA4340-LM2]|jgi:hypothetical protein|nr:hypothetical protein [Goleter apudmare HA4340-LM2]
MISKSSIQQSSPSFLNDQKLQNLVMDLNEEKQETISGGNDTKRYAKVFNWDVNNSSYRTR